jgi:hypothetical protein
MTRTIRRAMIATVAFVLVALAAAFAATPDGPDSKTQRAGVAAYRSGPLQRLVSQVGSLVVYQMKPALSDLGHGRIAPDQFQVKAAGWLTNIAFAQQQFDSCAAPGPLRPAAELYDEALQKYQQAVQAFNAAAAGPAVRRTAAMHAAAVVANGADATWDDADRSLNAVLRRYGVPTDKPVTPTNVIGC